MTPLPLLVGYAPVAGAPGDGGRGPAFVGTPSGRRLAGYAGLASDEELPTHFRLVNLYDDPEARHRPDLARVRLACLLLDLPARGGRVVLCSSVARDVLRAGREPLAWESRCFQGRRYQAAYLPHPSGLTRWWNDPENRAAARDFLAPLLRATERTST